MRIAYFTNQYPAVSHTFIRREIHALEALGVTIVRYALRGSPDELRDPVDRKEQLATKYIISAGLFEVLRCLAPALVKQPASLVRVLRLALRMGRRSDRGVLRHLAYAVEAVVLAAWCRRDHVEHVHAHFGTNPAAIAMLASCLSGISYSFTAHGSE